MALVRRSTHSSPWFVEIFFSGRFPARPDGFKSGNILKVAFFRSSSMRLSPASLHSRFISARPTSAPRYSRPWMPKAYMTFVSPVPKVAVLSFQPSTDSSSSTSFILCLQYEESASFCHSA